MLLLAVLRAQLSSYRFRNERAIRFFKQILGITTGLSCGVQLANGFLLGLDLEFQAAFNRHLFCYKRFVDDIIVVHDDGVNIDEMLEKLNAFDVRICVTHEENENVFDTHFLDLQINIASGNLVVSTYRKPRCSYNYTPADSNHAPKTLLGIVATEAVRLLRTNTSENTYRFQRLFFLGRLRDRGFDVMQCARILDKYQWKDKDDILSRHVVDVCSKKVLPFRLTFSPLAPKLNVGRTLREHWHFLDESVRRELRPVVCWTTSPNLFRERYGRFH